MSEMISLPVPSSAFATTASDGDRAVTATEFSAHIARPPAGVPIKGGLIVIHEIWGLVDHIKNVADRFAAEGYLVIAPDLLSSIGIEAHIGLELNAIMFSDDEKVKAEGQPRLRAAFAAFQVPEYATWALAALGACVDYLEEQKGVDGRIAVSGFCFGGTYSFALAAADQRVRAAVPFYGAPPENTAIARIAAPVLAFYGETDERLIDSLPEVTAAMQSAGVDFTSKVYENAGHAFFNDTSAIMYREEPAQDSWTRALAFLEESLQS